MRNQSALRAVFVLGFWLVSCSTAPLLKMEAQRPPMDESVVTPQLGNGRYKKLMVIPPSGTVRGQHDSIIAIFEKEFLRSGITVISGAITGRVVLDAGTEKKSEEGQRLSDAERALVMAKKTGADAILQIGEWAWSKENTQRRFFTFDPARDKNNYAEVSRDEYKNFSGLKIGFPSPDLHFIGRLTNVENGEVIASFDITGPANFNLPERYLANVEEEGDRAKVVRESFAYAGNSWLEEAKKTTEMAVIKLVCGRVLPAAEPKPAPVTAAPVPVIPPSVNVTTPDASREPTTAAPPKPETPKEEPVKADDSASKATEAKVPDKLPAVQEPPKKSPKKKKGTSKVSKDQPSAATPVPSPK